MDEEEGSKIPDLYDINCMLAIDGQMAQGYAILLSGTAQDPSRASKEEPSQQSIMLGFAALTDGNVVDACFGIREKSSEQGVRQAKGVKAVLGDAAMMNSKVPRIAVTGYSKAFRVIMKFQQEVGKLNFITRCFRYGGVQKNAIVELQEAFAPLREVMATTEY